MTDETREKLKDIIKEKPLQTAILKTPEYDRGFEHGRKEGVRDALKSVDLDEVIKALRECASGCGDAVDMFESATDPNAISIKAELQGYVINGRKVLRKLESLRNERA
jgi:hypothetical protein